MVEERGDGCEVMNVPGTLGTPKMLVTTPVEKLSVPRGWGIAEMQNRK